MDMETIIADSGTNYPSGLSGALKSEGSGPSALRISDNNECPDREGDVVHGDIEKPVKTIGNLALLSAAFNILNTWYGVGSTFIVGLSHGGPATLVYGFILLSVVYGATALCLAELSAHYPTAGGQYHWTSLLAPKRLKRGLSYSCGVANAIGRIAICASMTLINSQFILGLITFNVPSYEIQRWQVFLLYQIINVINFFYNAFALHHMSWTHHVGCGLSIFTFLFITIATLAVSGSKQPSTFVWATFFNESGWKNNGLVFMLGLINPNFGLGGLDGPLHLSEDSFNPAQTVPLSIIVSIVLGCVTTLGFTIAMLYCIIDLKGLVVSRTGVPLFEMWFQATGSVAWTNAFMALWVAVGLLTVIGSVSTASRLTWSFARDDALFGSSLIKKINAKQRIPINSTLYNAGWIMVLGCVYLSSTTAFSSLAGTGVFVEQISYAFPAALLLWRRRRSRYLPAKKHFNLGRWGWVANSITVAWTFFVAVIYSLPQDLPVTPGNMNYTCVVLAIVTVLAIVNWKVYADMHYKGPKVLMVS